MTSKTYKELREALKQFKAQGHKVPNLSSSKAVLQDSFDAISKILQVQDQVIPKEKEWDFDDAANANSILFLVNPYLNRDMKILDNLLFFLVSFLNLLTTKIIPNFRTALKIAIAIFSRWFLPLLLKALFWFGSFVLMSVNKLLAAKLFSTSSI